MNGRLTGIIEGEGGGYVVLCRELDIANQGMSMSEASDNLEEAIGLFCEDAPAGEVEGPLGTNHNQGGKFRRGGGAMPYSCRTQSTISVWSSEHTLKYKMVKFSCRAGSNVLQAA